MDYNKTINESFIEETKTILDNCKSSNILEIIDILEPKDIILGKRKDNTIEKLNFEDIKRNYFDSARIYLDNFDILEYGDIGLNIKMIHKKSIEDYISELEEVLVLRPIHEGSNKFFGSIELLIGKKISELGSLKGIQEAINENYVRNNHHLEEFFINNAVVSMVCMYLKLTENLIAPVVEVTHTSDILLNSGFEPVFYSKDILNELDIKKEIQKRAAKKVYKLIEKGFDNLTKCNITLNKKKRLKCKIDKVNKLIILNRKLYKYIPTEKRKEQILNKIEILEAKKNKYNVQLQKVINPKSILSKNLKRFR